MAELMPRIRLRDRTGTVGQRVAGKDRGTMRTVERNGSRGISVRAHDDGPGIPQPQQAVEDGYSSAGRLGLGLPGVKRLMDEFRLETAPGRGTTVTVLKWVR